MNEMRKLMEAVSSPYNIDDGTVELNVPGYRYRLKTDGSGLWSEAAKPVTIAKVQLVLPHREVRVYFDTDTWDVGEDGLIYTDNAFLRGLKSLLKKHGYDANGIDYSEQGMQGDDYVSLDADEAFEQSVGGFEESTEESVVVEDSNPFVASLQQLEDAQEEMQSALETLKYAFRKIPDETIKERARRMVLSHIETSLSSDHDWLGGSMTTLADIIDEVRERVDGEGELEESGPKPPKDIDWDDYEKRVQELEDEGLTRSDAQAAIDAEISLDEVVSESRELLRL